MGGVRLWGRVCRCAFLEKGLEGGEENGEMWGVGVGGRLGGFCGLKDLNAWGG